MDIKKLKRKTVAQIAFLAIILGIFLIIYPLLPEILFFQQKHFPAVSKVFEGEKSVEVGEFGDQEKEDGNRMEIEAIMLTSSIVEGDNEEWALNQGVWLKPNGSRPDQKGNVILTGHRFGGPKPFYHLGKIKKGDIIKIVWNDQQIEYRAEEIKTVKATDTYIEDKTEEDQLTLYTCTLTRTPDERIVVIAKKK